MPSACSARWRPSSTRRSAASICSRSSSSSRRSPRATRGEVLLSDAQRFGLKADPGDELLFQIFYDEKDQAKAEEQDAKYGELLKLNRAWKGFGRIAAQTAKQVILQRVREAERENVFNQYKERKGELISGIVRRFERGNIIVDLGGAEAVLPVRDQVPRESYRAGDRIVAYVVEIDKAARGPQIILSRTHKGLLEKLFEMEVPEIYEKIVRIEASAREAGARSKIAVHSRDRDVDPVGACVGMKGSRVQAVVQELRGEKIDIVPYDADPVKFVCNAIAPAEVARVLMDVGSHTMQLIVPDEKLSLAIGKKGQNVRLASQLTGWRIDIHSASKVTRDGGARPAVAGGDLGRHRRGGRGDVQGRLALGGRGRGRQARGADVGPRDRQRPGGAGDHHGRRSGGRGRAGAARARRLRAPRSRPQTRQRPRPLLLRRAAAAAAALPPIRRRRNDAPGPACLSPTRTCIGCRKRGPADRDGSSLARGRAGQSRSPHQGAGRGEGPRFIHARTASRGPAPRRARSRLQTAGRHVVAISARLLRLLGQLGN